MNRYKINDNDQAVCRAFPNARASVLLVPGVSNKNLLKNPYRTQSEPVGTVGVDNRPWSITTDTRGNVFARSSELLEPNITNINLLQNPYRTKTDPIDEPRVLTAQTIKDIGSGIFPKYIAEDRGINEVAYIILKGLHDDGVKLITISLLKSMITGKKITELLGKSQNQTMRALQFFDKLMSDATQLYKDNLLNDRLDELLAEYSKAIQSIYGPEILRAVPRAQVQEEIRKLGEISGVLSRMFRAQNQLEPGRLVPYETLMNLPPNPTPPIPQNTGDNEPSPPQEIKEPDNVRDINDPRTPANQVMPSAPPASAPPASAPPASTQPPAFAPGSIAPEEEEEPNNPPLVVIPQRPTRNGILSGALAVAGGLGRATLAVARGVGQSAVYVHRNNPVASPYEILFPPPVAASNIPYIPAVDPARAAPVAPAGVLNIQNRPNLALLDNDVARRVPVSADDNDQDVADDISRLRAARAKQIQLRDEALAEVSRLEERGTRLVPELAKRDTLELAEREQELAERRQDLEERKAAFERSKRQRASPLAAEPEEEEAPEEEKYLTKGDLKRREYRQLKQEQLSQNPFDAKAADEVSALQFVQNIRNGRLPIKEDPVYSFDMTDKRPVEYPTNMVTNRELSTIKQKATTKTALQIALSPYFKNVIAENFPNSIMPDYLYLIAKLTPAAKGGLTEAEGGFPKNMPANSPVKLNYLIRWLDSSDNRNDLGQLGLDIVGGPAAAAEASKPLSAGKGRKRKSKKASKTAKSTRTAKNNKSLDAQILSLLKE
jgi:hypothetical protein